MSQLYSPLLAGPARAGAAALPWQAARAGDAQTRLLHGLLMVASLMLSWHIIRPSAINLTLSDAALLGALALLLIRGQLEPRPFGALTPLWLLGLALMQGGLMVSTLLGGEPLRWLIVCGQYLLAWLLLPAILMSVSRDIVWRCLIAFLLGVTASQAIALTASLFLDYQDTWDVVGLDFITATGRIGAFSGNANTNGGMIAFALPMLLFVLHKGLLPRWAGLLCGAILLGGLIATASFTAFAAAVIGLGLMALLSNPRRFLIIAVPFAVLLFGYILSGLPLPGPFESRVGAALTSGDLSSAGTFLGRLELLKESWNLAGGTIFVGYGADQYRQISAHLAPVHVFPMLILVEGGLIALIGLLAMIGVMLGQAVLGLRVDRYGGAMAIAIFAVFMVFAFSVPHMYARLWIGPLFLALAAIYARAGPPVRGEGLAGLPTRRARR